MILNQCKNSMEEHERCIREHLCLYCGQAGHLRVNCLTRPSQQSAQRVSTSFFPSQCTSCIEIPITIKFATNSFTTKALIDSGAAGNFIDEELAQRCEIIPCNSPLAVAVLDGCPLGTGCVHFTTIDITLKVGILHTETTKLFLICSLHNPIILRLPGFRSTILWFFGRRDKSLVGRPIVTPAV